LLFDYRASVSDVQLFREEPALWLLKHHPDYLYRTESGPAAERGHAVEHGMRAMLRFGMDAATVLPLVQRDYLRRVGGQIDGKAGDEYANLPGYMEQCAAVIAKFELGKYSTYQMPIKGEIEGVNFLGYADFTFGPSGIDLKSTGRLPSEMRDTHQEQMSFYELMTGIRFACAYVTPKKYAVYTLTDDQYAAGLQRLRALVKSIKTACTNLTWEQLFDLYPPRDPTGFRWDERSRYFANNIWRN